VGVCVSNKDLLAKRLDSWEDHTIQKSSPRANRNFDVTV
jgi:hypothetical protein